MAVLAGIGGAVGILAIVAAVLAFIWWLIVRNSPGGNPFL